MDKIKKQFKDFWTYCKLLKYGANASDKASYRKFFALGIGVVVCVMLILGQLSSSSDTLRTDIFMPFMCGMAIATGIVTSYRPSLLGIAPYTPKQRVVFSYLATLLRGIVITILWLVAMIVIGLVFALLIFIFTGENILVVEDSAERVLSAYGNAHEVLIWVILVFSMYAISHLNSRKARNIAAVCFFAGVEILVLILVNACGFAKLRYELDAGLNDGLRPFFFLGSDVAVTIDYLAHPWVVIVVEAVLSVAAFGASLYASILRYKSGKI